MKSVSTAVGAGLCVMALAACGAAGGGGGGGDGSKNVTLTLATVNNGQMKDMEKLKGTFEKAHPGVTVNFQVMEEGDLRSTVTADVANAAGQYDIVTVGSYEVPQWGANGWLTDLTEPLSDAAYDVDDLLPPVRQMLTVDDKQYAVPFYGESSLLMYNKDILDAAGVSLSDRPTWQEVADVARAVNSSDTAGICLRGKPGWGDMFAPLTTVVQTFGGNWYDMDWNAQVNSPEFVEAVTFYTDLLADAGEADPVSYSFNECLTALKNGKVAMWYDASVAASMLEADDSPVKGKIGYSHAPVVKTEEAGWLWSWNLAVPKNSKNKDMAVEFVKWATSKEYHNLVGEELGWSLVPPGARTSTYENPKYQEAAAAFAPITLEVINSVDPTHPGVNPQPWVGVQYVTIPEFQDVGNQVSQLVADAIAGRSTVQEALDKGQEIAQRGGDAQK
ncbi:ABC transporter substrate-binding protein [Sanguibacter gelidistatuariae]|nr:sugar ABC transporter substrate-binding protein [Sanguibacter gelidistatuariae]